MRTSSRRLCKLLKESRLTNKNLNLQKLRTRVFVLSSLLSLIAALTIISPAQQRKVAPAAGTTNTVAIYISVSDIYDWIYQTIFSEPEQKSAEENLSEIDDPNQPVKINFEEFNPGTVDGQRDWKSSGSSLYGTGLDVEITDNNSIISPKSFGLHSLRLSNAYINELIGEQTFAGLIPNESGEQSADNLGQKRGERLKMFTSEWEFASADPTSEQYGLSVIASPTRRDGSQMSYIRMADTPDGIAVFFKEYKSGVGFNEVNIANGLDRAQLHKIKLDINFEEGAGNDAVSVYIDNELKYQGTTWEDFYRENGKSQPPTIDTISFNTEGSPYPANRGKGFLIDNIEMDMMASPFVQSITRYNPTNPIVNASSVVFRVVFDVPVNGVDAGDFVITTTGAISGAQVTAINTTSPFSVYDVTVSNYTGDGTLRLDVVDNNSIQSVTGSNPLGGPAVGDGNFNTGEVYTIDNTFPTVASINRDTATPTNAATVTYTVTFSENVQNVDATDFQLALSGVTASIASVSGTGSVYTVTVSSIVGNGTLGLNLVDDDTITDFVAPTPYRLGGTGPGNGNFTGEVYTIDQTAPTVSITPASGTFTTPTVNFTAQFSENVNNFVLGDIIVGNGTASNFVAVDGDTYTFDVTRTNDGTVTVDIPANVAADDATNPNMAATQASVTFDTLAPTPVVSTTSVSPTNVSPIPFSVDFGEAVNDFTATDVTVSGGSITMGSFTGMGGDSTYSFTVTPTSDGTVSVSVAASVAQDLAGNDNNSSGAPVSVVYDATAPTPVVSTTSGSPTNVSPIPFSVDFGEAVNDFVAGDITVSGGTVQNFATSDNQTYTFEVLPSGDGTYSVNIAANVAQDLAGNNNNSSGAPVSVVYDATAPTVVSIIPSGGTFSSSPVNFTVTFSEAVTDFDDASDVTVGGTSLPTTATITQINATTYNVAVGGMTGSGDLTIQVNVAAATDAANNPNASSSVNTVNFNFEPAGNFVITSANPQGWAFLNENTPGGVGGFVEGPGTPPLGDGSARLSVSATNQGQILAKLDYAGTRLDSITSLSYSTYGNSTTLSPALSLVYDQNLNDGITNFQGRLNYEPYLEVGGSPVQSGDWQTWDLLSPTARFWASSNAVSTVDDVCTNANPCTLAFILANFPNIGIHANPLLGGVVFKAGSGWASFDGNVDNFTIGINGNNQNFDFEPILPTVTVEQAMGQNDPTNASPINFTAEFSEDVTGFDPSDVIISGSMTAMATVTPIDGNTYTISISGMESGETVTVTIPAGAAMGAEGTNQASTSVDNMVTYNIPTVSIAQLTPGAEPNTDVVFRISLSGSNPSPVTVEVTTTNGSATAGSDYTALSASPVTIPANTMFVDVPVSVIDDMFFEPTEDFTATLANPTNATLGTATATGMIADDAASVVSINSASMANEGANVEFTVSINEPNASAVTVNYTLTDVTTSPADYTAPSGSVVIPANAMSAQIIVPTVDDNIDEPDETFTITLDDAANGTTVDPMNNVGTGTIVDTDILTVYVNDDFANPTPGQDPDGAGPATNFGVDSFSTVQGGVNGVAVGGTVIVYDGTYTEQVVISKDLTMDGESIGGTVIKVPSGSEFLPTNSVGDVVIVDINNGATVNMQELTVSGTFDYAGCGGPYFDGIFVLGGASLNLSNAAVLDIREDNPALFGCQNGFALSVGLSSTSDVGTATVTNVTFDGYQKEAVFVDGLGSNVNVQNSIFIGEGPSNTAQNIFQISTGATATINNSQIGQTGAGSQCNVIATPPAIGCGPSPDDYQGTGIGLFDAGAVTITNNSFTDSDNAISAYGANGNLTITGNTFSGNRYYGILLSQGTTMATGNTMTAPMNVGISVYSDGDDTGNAVATFNQNTILGATTGVQLRDFDLMNRKFAPSVKDAGTQIIRGVRIANAANTEGVVMGGNVPQLTANYNRIISTTTAIDNPQNNTADLQYNWWGCNAGPGNTGCGIIVGTGADFDPWVVLTASATPLAINPGDTSTVSADLSKDSGGNTLAAPIPDTPVAYTATEGTMNPTSDVITNNMVDTSVFTSNSSNDATATVTVDNQPLTFNIMVNAPSFAIDDVTQVETDSGTTNFVFTVTKTGTTAFSTSVDFETNDATATSPSDYAAQSVTTLNFGPTDITMPVTVVVNGDTMFELDETFEVNLSNAMMATISDAQGIGTITNDDVQPTVQFDPATFSGAEDNVNGYITITATRTGATGDAFTVDVTFGGDATGGADCMTAGVDYVNTMTTLSFAAGDTSQSFNVPICDDAIFEGDETFVATLSNPSAPVNLGTQDTATVTIVESPEGQPTVSISDATPNPVAEGNSATFDVTLSNPSDEQVDVSITIGAGGDTAVAADYSLVTTSVSFLAGETGPKTVMVNALTDNLFEGATAETFTVNLASVTTNNATIADGTGAGSISDVDVCDFVLTPTSENFVIAGGSSSFNVSVTNGCQWTATSNVSWINTTSTGNGNGVVNFTVASNAATMTNSGAARSGMITVAGINNGGSASFTVNQAAAPIELSIPTGLTTFNGGTLTVPVNISNTTGRSISAFDFDLTFNSSILTFTGVNVGPPATVASNSGWTNGNVVGNASGNTLSITGAGPTLSGAGTLINLTFTVIGVAPDCSDFDFIRTPTDTVLFGDGITAVPVNTTDGEVCITPGSISGIVEYANTRDNQNPPQPTTPLRRVPNVTLTAVGTTGPTVTDITDSNGMYDLLITADGDYTVTPSRPRAARLHPGITADDATLIQRARVGQIPPLAGVQLRAADVNKDGVANSFDASLIQQFKVQATPAAGNFTGIWEFNNPSNTYTEPNDGTQVTNYTAVLLGDPTGNWDASLSPQLADGSPDEKPIDSNPFFSMGGVQVTLPTTNQTVATNFNIPVTVSDLTGEGVSSFDFDITYNPTVITPQGSFFSTAGTLTSSGCSVFAGVIPDPNTGRLAISASCPSGLSGGGTLINLTFSVIGNAGNSSDLAFSPFIFNSGIPTNTSNVGQITIVGTTSASVPVGGSVVTSDGNPVSSATVKLINGAGEVLTVKTSSFGTFRFEDVAAGQTYTLLVESRRYQFTPQTIFVDGKGQTNIEFIAGK